MIPPPSAAASVGACPDKECASSMFLSSTVKFVVLMVVVDPLTVKLPVTVKSVPIIAEPVVSNCTEGDAVPIPILSFEASSTRRFVSPSVENFKSVVFRLSCELNICPVILPIAILYQSPTLLWIFIYEMTNTVTNIVNDHTSLDVHVCKYAVQIELPETLKNRPLYHWSERPDLQLKLKEFIDYLEDLLYNTCENNFVVGMDEIRQNSIEMHFESKLDKNRFIHNWTGVAEKIRLKKPKYAVSWLESVES